jgi:FkbM family methyltransferase
MPFSAGTRAGRIIRLPLRVIGRDRVMRIMSGPLRGMRWVVGSAVHGSWLGIYEASKSRAFAASIESGDVVFDIGANVGYYTLIAARRAGRAGKVHAFEPLPENVAFLHRHVDMNEVSGVVEVHQKAVTDGAQAEASFVVGENRSVGAIGAGGGIKVGAVGLDAFVYEDGNAPPDVVKIDIEGAEAEALSGAARLLAEKHPVIFLATHGADVEARCLELLATAGYRCSPAGESEWICR